MLNIKRILLPVDFPVASLGVLHQAATLARHFNSEISPRYRATFLFRMGPSTVDPALRVLAPG